MSKRCYHSAIYLWSICVDYCCIDHGYPYWIIDRIYNGSAKHSIHPIASRLYYSMEDYFGCVWIGNCILIHFECWSNCGIASIANCDYSEKTDGIENVNHRVNNFNHNLELENILLSVTQVLQQSRELSLFCWFWLLTRQQLHEWWWATYTQPHVLAIGCIW